jgi:hypothetical protein
MSTIKREDFTGSLLQLLKESFEGPPPDIGSAYLDKGAGLFQTLEKLSADSASAVPSPGAPTVAAHCEHVRFYVAALYEYMQGARGRIDWQQSWLVQAVSDAEWEELKAGLRREYETITEYLRSAESLGEEEVGGCMAILAHTAYHLGAIRQIARALA